MTRTLFLSLCLHGIFFAFLLAISTFIESQDWPIAKGQTARGHLVVPSSVTPVEIFWTHQQATIKQPSHLRNQSNKTHRPKITTLKSPASARPSNAAEPETSTAEVKEYRPLPEYPLEALDNEIEGEVWLEVETDQQGKVILLKVKKSSGEILLDEEAIKTVKRWQLTPFAKVIVPIQFQLSARDVPEALR